MRKLLASLAVFGSILVSQATSQAQQPAGAAGRASQPQQPGAAAAAPSYSANAGRFGVAVVDISYVFKKYKPFTDAIDALKKEMETADGLLKADSQRLMDLQTQRDGLKPGSDDFKKQDEELARQKAEFSIKQGTLKRDFLEREAQIYFTTYTKVSEVVKYVAQQNNIGMVLRFNGDPIDPQQREDVMRAIMQPIVYQNNVDITPDILALLARQPGAAPVSTATPGAPIRK